MTWLLYEYCGAIRIMYNSHPSPPSLPSLLSPSLPSPPLPPSPPIPSPPFPPSLPLVTQHIHCPFHPKQSPSVATCLRHNMKATLFITLKAGSRLPHARPKCLWLCHGCKKSFTYQKRLLAHKQTCAGMKRLVERELMPLSPTSDLSPAARGPIDI